MAAGLRRSRLPSDHGQATEAGLSWCVTEGALWAAEAQGLFLELHGGVRWRSIWVRAQKKKAVN